MRFGALLVVLASGCKPYAPSFVGEDVWRMFPFDGSRTWDYISTDTSLPYKVQATCDGQAERIKGKNVYTVQYAKDCVAISDDCVQGELQYQIRWSSDAVDGVFVHAFALGEDDFTDFDPPLQITSDTEKKDDAYTTSTGGASWTSTDVGTEACPVRVAADWPECAHWNVTTDGGDGVPVAGDWWTVAGNGVAAYQLGTDSGQWQLSDFDCQTDADCDGTW